MTLKMRNCISVSGMISIGSNDCKWCLWVHTILQNNFQIFTISKKLPVVLNFRCNLRIAECCFFTQLAANQNQYYKFYNTFNSYWRVSCSTVITLIFLKKKKLSLCMQLPLSTFPLTSNAREFVIRSIGTGFYLFFFFTCKNDLVTCWL